MAYLAPFFEADAFVSYSHGNPTGFCGDPPLKQWTLTLNQKVETEIRSLYPDFEDIVLWRDGQADPTLHLERNPIRLYHSRRL